MTWSCRTRLTHPVQGCRAFFWFTGLVTLRLLISLGDVGRVGKAALHQAGWLPVWCSTWPTQYLAVCRGGLNPANSQMMR